MMYILNISYEFSFTPQNVSLKLNFDENILPHYVPLHEDHLPTQVIVIIGHLQEVVPKNIQKQVNLFLTEINFYIFENALLPKCSINVNTFNH